MRIKDSVYFSLGGKEKNTTDPSMCHIEEDTRWTYEAFQKVAQTTFVHEPGGQYVQGGAQTGTWADNGCCLIKRSCRESAVCDLHQNQN